MERGSLVAFASKQSSHLRLGDSNPYREPVSISHSDLYPGSWDRGSRAMYQNWTPLLPNGGHAFDFAPLRCSFHLPGSAPAPFPTRTQGESTRAHDPLNSYSARLPFRGSPDHALEGLRSRNGRVIGVRAVCARTRYARYGGLLTDHFIRTSRSHRCAYERDDPEQKHTCTCGEQREADGVT